MSKQSKSILANLSFLDLYASPITVLLNRDSKFSTPLGQVGSLFILLLSSFVLALQTIDMFTLSNPNIVNKVVSTLQPEAYELNPENFVLGIGVADSAGKPILNTEEKKFYSLEFYFCNQIDNVVDGVVSTQIEYIPIDMIPCPQARPNPELIKGLQQERLLYAQCLNTATWNNTLDKAKLSGLETAKLFSYISVGLLSCDPLNFQNCATPEELKVMEAGFLTYAFTDNLLDQSQPGNPYNHIIKTSTTQFAKETLTIIRNYFRHTYFQNIENFYYFFPTQETYHVLTLVDSNAITIKSGTRLAYLQFYLDDKAEYYTRTYSTFFDIFANVSGFQKFLTVVFGLLIAPIAKLSQNLTLINQIFDVKVNEDQETEKSFARSSTRQIKEILNSDSRDGKQINKSLRRLITQKNQKMQLKCYQMLCIGCDRKRTNLLKQGTDKLESQMDITNIINKLFELEKLKQFLLDDNQLKLFEYIPRPEIKEQQEIKKNSVVPFQRQKSTVDYFMKDQHLETKVDQALASYKLLKKSQKESDVRLIELMNPKVKDLFEQQITEQPVMHSPRQKSDINEIIDEFNRLGLQSAERFSDNATPRMSKFARGNQED